MHKKGHFLPFLGLSSPPTFRPRPNGVKCHLKDVTSVSFISRSAQYDFIFDILEIAVRISTKLDRKQVRSSTKFVFWSIKTAALDSDLPRY